MKPWTVFAVLASVLAVLALSAGIWLPPLLAFVGANSDVIQGLESMVQLILWLGCLVLAWLGYRRRRAETSAVPPVDDVPEQ